MDRRYTMLHDGVPIFDSLELVCGYGLYATTSHSLWWLFVLADRSRFGDGKGALKEVWALSSKATRMTADVASNLAMHTPPEPKCEEAQSSCPR